MMICICVCVSAHVLSLCVNAMMLCSFWFQITYRKWGRKAFDKVKMCKPVYITTYLTKECSL